MHKRIRQLNSLTRLSNDVSTTYKNIPLPTNMERAIWDRDIPLFYGHLKLYLKIQKITFWPFIKRTDKKDVGHHERGIRIQNPRTYALCLFYLYFLYFFLDFSAYFYCAPNLCHDRLFFVTSLRTHIYTPCTRDWLMISLSSASGFKREKKKKLKVHRSSSL